MNRFLYLFRRMAPVIIYLCGILFFFLADILVSSSHSSNVVAEWANIKSFVMIASPFLLAGMNNLYVRWPDEAANISCSIIGILGIALFFLIAVQVLSGGVFPRWYVDVTIAYCISLCGMSYLRAKLKFVLAQLQQNLWKILIFLLVAASSYLGWGVSVKELYRYSLWVGVVVLLFSVFEKGAFVGVIKPKVKSLTLAQYGFAFQMMLSTGTMAASAYASVFFVSSFSENAMAASFFAHYIVFTAFAVVVSGYIGFSLTPMLKSAPEKYLPLIVDYKRKIFSVSFALFALNLFLGCVLFDFVYGGRYEVNYLWATFLSLECIIRSLYVLPTSILGAFSDGARLTSFVILGVVGCLILVLLSLLGIYMEYLVVFVLLGSMANWLLRYYSASRTAMAVISEKKLINNKAV
ncbi:hypothetical protein [Alloalcanivorax xenomutans]|uniref:hypothetical protein n=1 Tax=Alloalcanivorax xenomutans TaxID=1094342 RepID=UPI001F17D898|nr:hypothetical protein [Alloalcanivorax xenomutans]MCE7523499.1 hypothetical protein [Alloalcanivorax xenomutans]